mgnify:CR=1 FL=1
MAAKTITITLSDEDYNKIHEAAKEHKVYASSIVRKVLKPLTYASYQKLGAEVANDRTEKDKEF